MKSFYRKHFIIYPSLAVMFMIDSGCGAKSLALLQNQCKPSQLGKLINLITGKKVHKGKNHSIKLRKYYFCTTTLFKALEY